MIWTIPLYLILGFLFGKLTCSAHVRRAGMMVTILLFSVLNLVHSMIDGVALLGFAVEYRNWAMYAHEFIRQPMLYVVIWAVLQPFTAPAWRKVIYAIIAVTGVWLLGVLIGRWGGQALAGIESLHSFFEYGIFFFIGDIVHHLVDEIIKWSKGRKGVL